MPVRKPLEDHSPGGRYWLTLCTVARGRGLRPYSIALELLRFWDDSAFAEALGVPFKGDHPDRLAAMQSARRRFMIPDAIG